MLANVVDGEQRHAILSVDEGEGCADPSTAVAGVGTTLRPLSHCLLRADASRDAALELELGGSTISLPPPPDRLALRPARITPRADGIALEVDTIDGAIAVGIPTIAAVIRVWDHGQPSSHVEINITSKTARLRALDWLSPGVATVELEIPTYVPVADLSVVVPEGGKQVELAVDPGPPTELQITPPTHVVQAQRFELSASVHTTSGTRVDAARVRVVPLDRCVANLANGFSCGEVGLARFVVRVRDDDASIPIDVITLEVAPPPKLAPVVERRRDSWWSAAARLSGGELGLGGGVAASAGLERGRGGIAGTLSWTVHRDTFSALQPVTSSIDLTVHEVAAIASIATARRAFFGRVGVGPALVIERAAIDAAMSGSLAFVGVAQVAVGRRFSFSRQFVDLELGAQVHADLVGERWVCSAASLFAGVSFGRR